MANNPKHVFDFEAIINTQINQSNWRENKRKLQDAFGEIKVGIESGMMKEDAQKVVDILNKGFEKANMPKIDVSDFMDQIDDVAEKFTKALGLINNIDTSALKNIETSLEHISDVMDEIAPKIGKGVEKAVKGALLSVNQLDNVLGELGDSAEKVGEALNFAVEGDAKKQGAALKKIKAEYEELERERIAAVKAGDREDAKHWLQRQEALVKYVRTYESYVSGLKNKKDVKQEYADLYGRLLPKSHDARTNLQNLVDRRAGTFSAYPEPWAKEKTLEEVRDILKGGLLVKSEGSSDNDGSKNNKPRPRDNKGNNIANKAVAGGSQTDNTLTLLANRIVATINEAKSKRSLDWDTGTTNSVRTELILEAIKSNFMFVEDASDDDKEDLVNNAVAFSTGAVSLQEIVEIFKPLVFSLEDIYNKLPKNMQELVRQYAEFDDPNSNEALDAADHISDIDPKIGALIADAVESYPEQWAKFKGKIKPEPISAPSGTGEAVGVDAGALGDISRKIDSLAKDSSISAAKDAIVSAIGSGGGQVDLAPGAADALVSALKNINISHSTEVPEVDTTNEQEQFKSLGSAIDNVTTSINAKTQAFENEETTAKTAVENEIAILNELEAKLAAIKTQIGTLFADAKLDEAGSIDQYITKLKDLDTEITTVKKAFKELSKVIGQKNAGFIKGQKAVNAALEAEQQVVEGLVNYVSISIYDIVQDLTKLRAEFERPLTFPEMNKANLNSVFDEIYRKFTELMDKIGASGLNFDINSEGITTAIKEALYSKEIFEAGYRKATFEDVMMKWDDDDWQESINFGSKSFSSEEEARKYFDENYKGKYFNPSEFSSVKTLDKIINQTPSAASQTENWVQVIIQELKDGTGKIVESIKLLLPQDIVDNIDESSLIQAFDKLTQSINNLIANGDIYSAKGFFRNILDGNGVSDPDVANALVKLGLMSDSGDVKFRLPGIGGVNSGVAIGEDLVYHTTPNEYAGNVVELMEKQNKAYELGANVPRILAAHVGDELSFQLQAKATGRNFRDDPGLSEIWEATDEQIDRLLHTFDVLEKTGLVVEFGGDNVLFDKEKGFTVIDLANETNRDRWDDQTTASGMFNSFMRHMGWARDGASLNDTDKITELMRRMQERHGLAPEDRLVNANTVEQERMAARAAEAKARSQQGKADPQILNALTAIAQEKTLQSINGKLDNLKVGGTEEIASAMKEALYAKEIAEGGYKHITSFDQAFTENTNWDGSKEYVHNITGEVFHSLQSATDEFERFWKDVWTNIHQSTGIFAGTQDQLISNIERDREINAQADKSKWTQVIVEAITTQTGEIVEAIKLLIPQDVAESNAAELAQAFDVFINFVSEWSRTEWTKPGELFRKMLNGYLPSDKNVQAALKTLGLISEDNIPKFVVPGTGVRNLGVAVGDTSVVSTQSRGNVDDPEALMEKLNKANDMGAAVPRILGMNENTIGHNGRQRQAVFFLQTLASGANITDHNTNKVNVDSGLLDATDEQIDGLLHTFEKIEEVGLYIDLVGDNILFDKDKGFSAIDFNTDSEGGIGTNNAKEMVKRFLSKIDWAPNLSPDQKNQFIERVKQRRALSPEQRLVNDKVVAERIRKQQEEAARQAEKHAETDGAEGGLDKASLEEVLTNVFKNVLNPQAQPSDERAEDSPFALEATLQQVKDVLGKIKTDTSMLKDGKIQLVPVDDASDDGSVRDEVASGRTTTATAPQIGKQIDKMSPDGEIVHRVIVDTHKTDEAFETDKLHFAPDEDGALQIQMVEIIKDFDKLRKEEAKSEQAIARAQKKVNEFVAKFESKTGGNAKFVEGFNELSSFTVNEKNIDEAYNKMIELQRNYAQLETNFRKGQSSLNPFVNAMNRAQNIDNIFGDIDNKFKGLAYRSEELVETFGQLEALSKEIHNFVARMNDPDAEPITPAEFTKFSEQMGDFIATKVKFDGIVRSDKDKNREAEVHNAQVETELIKGLVKLYEQLGKAQAMGDAEEASRLRSAIKTERDKLLSVDYATDMRFKSAKEKGRIDAENAALREQMTAIEKLNKLYREYGELKEAAAFAGDTKLGEQLTAEVEEKLAEINAARSALGEISPELEARFADSMQMGGKKSRNNQLRAAAKKTDADEAARLSKIAKLEKEIGRLRAEADTATNPGVKAALEEEISIREQLIELQKEGRELNAESEAYFKQIAANETAQAKKMATEQEKEQVRLWKKLLADDKKLKKRQAMTGKAGNAIGRAENVWIEAEGLDFAKLPKGFQKEIEEYYNKIDALRVKQHELNTADVVTPEQRDALIGQTREVNKLTEKIGRLVSEYQNLSGENVKEMNVQNTLTARSGIKEYEDALKDAVRTHTNGKAQIKSFNAETKTLTYTVKTGAHEFTEYTAAVRHLDNQFVAVQGTTKRTETFLEATKRKMGELASYMSGMSLFSRATQELRKGIQYIREIDLALTELKKVTDETEETYDQFLKTAAKTGARLGSTISAVTEATATFAKLGYSMEQATEMAESAIVYKNVGDNIASTEDAADSIISTMKGFKLEATESMEIVDRFNEVGNRFAITSQGIGEALRLSASALSEGGNSLDEAIGLITAANEVVNDPSSVGTALKTLTLRLRGSKTELEEMGEDVTDMATTTSQLQAKLLALTGGQVDIMADANTFKNSTQILREMADAWEDMNDIQRASALELMGGKRQANVLSALIQNFDTVERVIKTSVNSTGSALKENERYLDSIQGKIDQFNNAMQAMWNNTLNSDWVKGIVKVGTEIIKLVDEIGLLTLALTGLFTYISTKYMNINWSHPISSFKQMFGKGAVADINLVQKNLKQLEAEYESAKQAFAADPSKSNQSKLTNIEARLEEYRSINAETIDFQNNLANAQSKLVKAQNRLNNYTGTNASTIKKYQNDVKKAQANVDALNQSQQRTAKTGSTGWTALGNKVSGFAKKVQSAISAMLVMYAISKVMQVVGDLWDKAFESAEEAKESFDELSSALSKTESELGELESTLDDIQSQIKEINENTPLTFADQEELSRLKEQSAELQRQIDLTKVLKEQQQYDVNKSAIGAANKYGRTGVNTGKTTGENIGSKAGTGALLGGAIGSTAIGTAMGSAILGAIKGGTAGSAGGPWGAVIGIIVGLVGGALVGAGVGAIESAAEEKVGESLDNMKAQYAKLQEEFNIARDNYQHNASDKNKKKFEASQEALRAYQSNMANYMSEMDSYYSQIKKNWEVATDEQKKEYIAWADKMDTWAIQSNSPGAKSNAIARVFGDEAQGNVAKARDEINKLKENLTKAQKSGEGIDEALSALEEFELNLSKEEVERLRAMGIYLYEVEDYFKDVIKVESEFVDSGLEGVVKDINKITDELGSLKSAFEEVVDKGYITAKTLANLKDELKISDSSPESVTDAWREYMDVMMSGVATTEQMTQATEKLAQEIIEAALAANELNPDTKFKYIVQLRDLGIQNAQEYVEELLQKNMVQELELKLNTDSGVISDETKLAIAERYEVEESAIDAIIAKLKEKQDLEQQFADKQTEQNEHNDWRNGDGTTPGILALQADLKNYQDIADRYGELANTFGAFNYGDWQYFETRSSAGYRNINTGTQMGLVDFQSLQRDAKRYNEYVSLKQKYDALWKEGEEKGYIVDGKVVDPDFKAEIDDIQEKINGISTEIDNELTVDVKLKLQLQEFDDAADRIQSAYTTLKDITTEYNIQGYLSLDNLQALLSLSPEYLAVLQMEGGQLTINQSALEAMLKTKLADAEATAVQTAITQLNALAERKKAIEVSNSAVAANQASIELGTYSGALSDVASDAIVAAGSVAAFNAALKGAQDNEFVSDEEWQQILTNFENTVGLIDSVRDNLPTSFNDIVDPGSQTAPEEVEDDRFQKAMNYWENRIAANQSKYEQLQNEIDLLESRGQKADASYYNEQMRLENERLWLLGEQKKAAQAHLDTLTEGSDEWWEVANTLNDIESELDGVTASIVDLQDAIGEIDAYKFEEFHKRLDDITSKLETIRNLMAPDGEEDWFDDQGQWTEEGVAVLGSYIQELETYKQGLAEITEQSEKYSLLPYAGNVEYYETLGIHSEQEYYDKMEELIDQQYSYAELISDTEQSVVDMYESNIGAIEEYTETLIDSYNDYIDSVKEALDAERDLYDFKKNVQKQSKDIAAIERRIASLSGSTNASDVAERRKLEAQLYESRESLNDTYYDHARSAQDEALDAERTAYEETMNKFIDGLRLGLETATANMDEFLMSVTSMVTLNAGAVLSKYQETELPLGDAITNPWEAAITAIGDYDGDALELMNKWTQGGFFDDYKTGVSSDLSSPWTAGSNAANTFKTSVDTVMNNVVSSISTNVKTASGELSKLYQQILDTKKEASEVQVDPDTPVKGAADYVMKVPKGLKPIVKEPIVELRGLMKTSKEMILGPKSFVDENTETINGTKYYRDSNTGYYYKISDLNSKRKYDGGRTTGWAIPKGTWFYTKHAKGTTGTDRDEWAITDEPKFGDELVLVPGKDGNLSFMRKGTGVVPADLTQKLFELAQIPTSDLMNKSLTAIVPNITKNDFKNEFNFESLVHVDTVDSDTLPKLEKMVDKKIDDFSKALNYSLKRFAR